MALLFCLPPHFLNRQPATTSTIEPKMALLFCLPPHFLNRQPATTSTITNFNLQIIKNLG
jgi:hypothetical protein